MNTCYHCTPRTQTFIGLFLMAFMLATRFHHFGDALHLPDASWAIFFLAGLYLSPPWIGALMLQAVAIDVAAVGWMGVPGYCLTTAYGALLLAYGVLWQGGRWLRVHGVLGLAGLPTLAVTVIVSALAAFALSNGAFYWLGGRVTEPNLPQFLQTWVDYAPAYLGVMALYVGLAALVHEALAISTRRMRRA
ncbi:MAG: hypothetical protein H6935_13340 [Thiobacillus sp.]|nr:hypothetical protein [Thiobacillus sp.]